MSNKTPTKPDEETESALKNRSIRHFIMPGLAICVLMGILLYKFASEMSSRKLTTPNGTINIEWLDSSEERILGLSGRDSIADDAGLLFVFDRSSTQNCFWMKDMKFSIDMVWLNEAKQVVTVAQDVSPETFPDSFCPDSEALYGLEIGEGRAEDLGIEPGVSLSF